MLCYWRLKRWNQKNCRPNLLPPANEVWGKVIFLHQFVILFTGGRAWLLWGGMRGCSGGVHGCSQGGMCGCSGGHAWLLGGHAWLLWGGACVVAPGGHAWLLWGGMRGCLGGMHGFIWGVCMVLFGGACVVFSVFSDTMRYSQWAGGTHPTGMHSC